MPKDARNKDRLLYSVDETPPWYLCIVLGFQHYLTMFGSTVAVPLVVTPAMCFADDDVGKSEIIGTIFFVSGIATLLQTTLGCRLPIVQSSTFSFLTPTFAILSLPRWTCPETPDLFTAEGLPTNNTRGALVNITGSLSPYADWRKDVWTARMREIQGAIVVASLFEVVLGLVGIIGIMLRFIGPLVIAPTIFLIGFSLFKATTDFASQHWGIAILTIFLMALFSQYLRGINIPCCKISREGCSKTVGIPLFKMFPVILAILTSWLFCYILTLTEVFPSDPETTGYFARTDTRTDVLRDASWFRFPYPGQWGVPTVSTAAVFGMLAGVLAGTIESVGDYYACARIAGAPPPPVHAVNRGILIEGIGCVLAGIWGSGSGTTTYTENIGAIAITKVGSRRVVQVGASLAILLGMLGKFGALFVSIPSPIVGGVFMVMFGTVAAVGISNLQYVDLNSSRNLFVFGFAMFFGFATPEWIKAQGASFVNTGSAVGDQIITVLLTTNMFVGGVVAFILDNTVPGTDDERGIHRWRETSESAETNEDPTAVSLATYDFPWTCCMSCVTKVRFFRFIPFCPSFNEACLTCTRCRPKSRKSAEHSKTEMENERDSRVKQIVVEPAGFSSGTGTVLWESRL